MESKNIHRRTLLKSVIGAGIGVIGSSQVATAEQATGPTVYTGSQDGSLYAFDALTGSERWEFEAGVPVESSPVVHRGTVYFGSREGLYAINAVDGTEQWLFETDRTVRSSPAAAAGTIYFGSDGDRLYAVTAEDGSERWAFGTDGGVFSAPVVNGATVYVGSANNQLYAVSRPSGDEKWSHQTSSEIQHSPAVSGNSVFIGLGNFTLHSISAQTGRRQWEYNLEASVATAPTVADSIVYIGTKDGDIHHINTKTGEREWRPYEVSRMASSSPVITNKRLYVGSANSNIYAFSTASKEKEWDFQTGYSIRSTPIVVDNIVYVGSDDGSLYAINAESGEKRWAARTGDSIDTSPTVVQYPTSGSSVPSGANVDLVRAKEATEAVQRLQAGIETTTSPPDEAVSSLQGARKALNRNEYEAAKRHARAGLEALDASVVEAATVRADLEAFSEQLASTTEEVDTDEPRSLYEQAQTDFEAGNYEQASTRLEEAEQTLEQAIAKRQAAVEAIDRLQSELRTISEEFNTTTPENKLSQARTERNAQNYEAAEKHALHGLDKLKQMQEFRADARRTIDSVESLDRHDGVERIAEEFGFNEALERAQSSYNNGDYRDAYVAATTARRRYWAAGFIVDGGTGGASLLLLLYVLDADIVSEIHDTYQR